MSNHNPATALPWLCKNRFVFAGTTAVAKTSVAFDGFYSDEDAAYIAHACNAYPELVEALRELERTCHPVNTVYSWDESQRKAIANARALLAKLGEA